MSRGLGDVYKRQVQKRTVALVENGTWAAASGRLITKELEEMKEMQILDKKLSLKSVLKQGQEEELEAFVSQIVEAM